MVYGFFKRVVGGSAAKDGQFPFAVFINSPALTNNTACAGAILTDQIVATSSYCVYDVNKKATVDPKTISVGYWKVDKSQQPATKVIEIISNSGYNPTTRVDDIALLQVDLSQAIKSSSVNRIPVYTGSIDPNDSLTVMGWGTTNPAGTQATNNILNYANVTVGDNYNCGQIPLYQGSNGRVICTRDRLTPGVAACLGDYGGPLITYDNGMAKLVGLFSSFAVEGTSDGQMHRCGGNNTLSYYTHASTYLPFLRDTTGLQDNQFTGNQPLKVPGDNGSGSGISKGAIIGICVGGAVALILIIGLAYWVWRMKKKSREIRQEQRIYELGLQQLADELGGSYEPKESITFSIFSSSATTPPNNESIFNGHGPLNIWQRRRTIYSDSNSDIPFSDNIPQPEDVGTELVLDTLGKTTNHLDGTARVMDFIRPVRDGKIADYYQHLLYYKEKENEETDNLISL